MPREYRDEGSAGRTAVLIVGIVGLVVMVVVAVCGGIAFVVVRTASHAMASMSQAVSTMMEMATEMQAAQMAAQMFLSDIGGGHLDLAYADTSRDFQARTSPKDFQALIDSQPALQGQTTSFVNSQNFTPKLVMLTMTVSGPKGSVRCTLHLVKEDERWKVDRFTVP